MSNYYVPGRFEGKVMIITGAATGIGRATAIRAAKEGAKLVLVDRKDKESDITLEMVKEFTNDVVFMKKDLTDPAVAKEMVQVAVEQFGGLDIAINNAGVMGNPNPVHNLPEEDVRYTMENNFFATYYCCHEEVKAMIKQGKGGAIVNNASIAGLTGLPGNCAYVSSKHAVNGLTRNMAVDYAKFGIRVNSVNPAGTSTPMVEEAMAFVKAKIQEAIANGLSPEEAQTMAGGKTLSLQNREATPEEQAAAILFLVSEDASNITGVLMPVDGGWTAF